MSTSQLALFSEERSKRTRHEDEAIFQELRSFSWDGRRTQEGVVTFAGAEHPRPVPFFTNEFWTSRQRAASSLHEVSYRACFKPQLPRFFIERLTDIGDRVYDPFSGRGTTALEAKLLGRIPVACDINPVSRVLLEPRLTPPLIGEIEQRLTEIPWSRPTELRRDLAVFYHPETLREICVLRHYFLEREASGEIDLVDKWIRMVAVNRLTGHSPGFFSVYTLPPNQAVSLEAQAKINAKRQQQPPRRDVRKLIQVKSRSLLADVAVMRSPDEGRATEAQLVTGQAASTPEIRAESIDLVVTSPPFLDVVDYAGDNWLRCWFCGIDTGKVAITMAKRPQSWQAAMQSVLEELFRVLRPGKFVAFEVGEVRGGKLKLEDLVLPAAVAAGFDPLLVLINSQIFTKTANCWGVGNNTKGTNTNRIVLLQKPL